MHKKDFRGEKTGCINRKSNRFNQKGTKIIIKCSNYKIQDNHKFNHNQSKILIDMMRMHFYTLLIGIIKTFFLVFV